MVCVSHILAAPWYRCTNVCWWFVHTSGEFFAYSGVPHGIGLLSFFCDLCTPQLCCWHILVCLMVLVYHCLSVICAALCCVLRIFWLAPWYRCTIVIWWFVHPYGVCFAYSGCPMVSVYKCVLVNCSPLWWFFRIFWRASWYWCAIVFLCVVHPSAMLFAYSGVPHGIGVPLFFCDLCTPLLCFAHILACILASGYYCFLLICAPLWCVFRIFWVPHGIGVLMCIGELFTPLVSFSHSLACLMVLVCYCFSVICAPLLCVFRIFWRASGYWRTDVFRLWCFLHIGARVMVFAYPCFSVICPLLWCVFGIFWCASWYQRTIVFWWSVHPACVFSLRSGAAIAYSNTSVAGVRPGIGVPTFFGDLFSPLVRFSHILACLMVLAY